MPQLTLDERMKLYERAETSKRFLPKLPICARLDGRCFHSFTRKLKRPYDRRLSILMIDVTSYLVNETCAKIGYTQSDEITLIFHSDNLQSQIFFDGKPHKLLSILAAMTTAMFNSLLPDYLPGKAGQLPLFDCRVWPVPTKEEAINVLVWREQDAVRNSISMAAQANFSHNQLHKKNTADMLRMLKEIGIDWDDYPPFFKRGTYIQRAKVVRRFTADELEKLPPKHEARANPDLEVERTVVRTLDLPPILQVKNRVDVVFDGQVADTN